MKLLLDTHTLLWAIGKTCELSETAIHELKNPHNEVMVSAVSLWEIAVKKSIGKLIIDFNVESIPEYCKKMGFVLIPLEPEDALSSLQLPFRNNHKDPFDRMLIYQCIKNKYTFVSNDVKITTYAEDGLKYLW